MTVELNRFDLETWKENTVTLIVSDERHPTAENLCYKFLEKYCGSHMTPDLSIVFSQYLGYNDYVDGQFLYDHYDHDILEGIISRQKRLLGTENIPSVLLLFDDENITSQALSNDFALKELIFDCRHYNITVVIKIPYDRTYERSGKVYNVHYDPDIRSQLDYVIVYPNKSKSIECLFYEQFFNGISFELYTGVNESLRRHYYALVYSYNREITYLQ